MRGRAPEPSHGFGIGLGLRNNAAKHVLWSLLVVFRRQVSMTMRACSRLVNQSWVRRSSRGRPLNLSTYLF